MSELIDLIQFVAHVDDAAEQGEFPKAINQRLGVGHLLVYQRRMQHSATNYYTSLSTLKQLRFGAQRGQLDAYKSLLCSLPHRVYC